MALTPRQVYGGSPYSDAYQPIKTDIIELWQATLAKLGGANAGALIQTSKTALDALAPAANTMAWVIGDPDPDLDGVYQYSAGTWTKRGPLPYGAIHLNNAGAGTADAIEVTTAFGVPDAAFSALYVLNAVEANTGPVTVSINGGAPKPVVNSTGSALDAGSLQPGAGVLGLDDGTNIRLFLYGDVEAILAAAEAARDEAQAAANQAETVLAGAMQTAEYDPTGVGADAFNSANHAFAQTGTGAVERSVLDKLRSKVVSIQDYGTSADWSVALAAARTAAGPNGVVVLGRGVENDYGITGTLNIYPNTPTDALGAKYVAGTAALPADRVEPVLWIEKITETDRAIETNAWDMGAAYVSLEKVAGDAYGAAFTAYARSSGGAGDMVAMHGRARAVVDGAQVFGGWSYAHVSAAAPNRAVAHEIDVNNDAAPTSWTVGGAPGDISAIVIGLVDTDQGYGAHDGIRFSNPTGVTGNSFWTGIEFDRKTIKPCDANGNGEAIRVRGAISTTDRSGAFALGDSSGTHWFEYGLRTVHASFANNAAIWLGSGQRIVWGAVGASSNYLTYDDASNVAELAGGALNLSNATAELRIAGVKVVDSQQSALPADAVDAATAATLANAIKARMISHGLVAVA